MYQDPSRYAQDRHTEERDLLWGLPDPETRPAFYAHVPTKRLVAWLIDTLLVGILTAIIVPFTAFTALFFLPVLFLVLGFLYRWVTISNRSATWGMRMMGIEIRDRAGERLDSGMAFLHTLGFTLTSAFIIPQLLSAALMLTQSRGQGLHDLVLGTTALNRAG